MKSVDGISSAEIAQTLKQVTQEQVQKHGILLAIWYACGDSAFGREDMAGTVQDELYDACVKAAADSNHEGIVDYASCRCAAELMNAKG